MLILLCTSQSITFSYIRRRSNFHGLILKTMVERFPPITIVNKDFKTNAQYFPKNKTFLVNGFTSGLFHDVWQIIEQRLNFTSLFYKQRRTNWGNVIDLQNGTFLTTGLIKEVYKKKVDVVVAPLTIKSPRPLAVSFLPPLYQETMRIAIPNTAIVESLDFTTFLRPLHYSLWIAILMTIITVSLMKATVLEKKTQILFQLLKYCWDSTLPIFGGASSDDFKGTVSYKILLTTSLLSGYVIWTSYNAALTSELLITEKTYPFKDLESVSVTNWR